MSDAGGNGYFAPRNPVGVGLEDKLRSELRAVHTQVETILQDLRHARWQLEHVYAHHRREEGKIEGAPARSQIGWWREGLSTIDDLIGSGYADQIIDGVQADDCAAPLESRCPKAGES